MHLKMWVKFNVVHVLDRPRSNGGEVAFYGRIPRSLYWRFVGDEDTWKSKRVIRGTWIAWYVGKRVVLD